MSLIVFNENLSPVCDSCGNHIIQLISSCWCRCGGRVSKEMWIQFLESNPHPYQFGTTRKMYDDYFEPPFKQLPRKISDQLFNPIPPQPEIKRKSDYVPRDSDGKLLNQIDYEVDIDKHFETIKHQKIGTLYLHKNLIEQRENIVEFLTRKDGITKSSISIIFTFRMIHTDLMYELKAIDELVKRKKLKYVFIVHKGRSRDIRNNDIVNSKIRSSLIVDLIIEENQINLYPRNF